MKTFNACAPMSPLLRGVTFGLEPRALYFVGGYGVASGLTSFRSADQKATLSCRKSPHDVIEFAFDFAT